MGSAAQLQLTIFVALVAFVSLASAQPFRAQCVFKPTSEYGRPLNVQGHISFYADTLADVRISTQISGNLGNAQYAISINEFGDLTDMIAGQSAGPRFRGKDGNNHGCPPDDDRYAGDLGNWNATNGIIAAEQNISLIELADDQYSIVGLSAVLYASADNCTDPSLPNSNRLAVCVIGITNTDNNPSLNANADLVTGVAVLQPTSNCNASCFGTVWFTDTPQGVQVVASVAGLKLNTKHGFHIHQYGDLSASDGSSAGAHWNPNGRNHELPGAASRHVGDLGNIQSFDPKTGRGWYSYVDSNIPNVYSLLGRTVVVHADVDHGSGAGCDQAGTSGKRILIGIIGTANTMTVPPVVPITVDNKYENLPCVTSPSPVPKPESEDTSGLKAGLAIGWVLVGLLSLVVIPGMIAYYWLKIRPATGEFYRTV